MDYKSAIQPWPMSPETRYFSSILVNRFDGGASSPLFVKHDTLNAVKGINIWYYLYLP